MIYRLIRLIRYTHKKIHTMPNWSHSRIVITLPSPFVVQNQAQRQTLWEIWRDLKYHLIENRDDYDKLQPFNILRPRPADEEDNWYEWNSTHWGTKWDLRLYRFEIEGREITLEGNTAWGPPIYLLEYLHEIGFEIYADHISLENQNWGYTEDGHTTGHDLYGSCIWEEDEEDHVATKLFEYECENGIIDDHDSLINYIAWGDFDEENHIPQYLREYIDDLASDMFDRYNGWKENFGKNIGDDDTKSLRQSTLEILEDSLEFGKINEGQYLELVNKLKKLNRDELNHIVEQYSLPQMTHYYRQGVEPQMIDCYA